MYDGHLEVVGESIPGLIRLGTITSYNFDKIIEGYVDDCKGFKVFFGSGRGRDVEKGMKTGRDRERMDLSERE